MCDCRYPRPKQVSAYQVICEECGSTVDQQDLLRLLYQVADDEKKASIAA